MTVQTGHSTVIVDAAPEWPEYIPIEPERVVVGSPLASTLPLHKTDKVELGLWRVTSGEFSTAHHGYVEFITILDGDGELVHDDGTSIALAPGVVITMADGWTGRWIIKSPVVKSYTIVSG